MTRRGARAGTRCQLVRPRRRPRGPRPWWDLGRVSSPPRAIAACPAARRTTLAGDVHAIAQSTPDDNGRLPRSRSTGTARRVRAHAQRTAPPTTPCTLAATHANVNETSYAATSADLLPCKKKRSPVRAPAFSEKMARAGASRAHKPKARPAVTNGFRAPAWISQQHHSHSCVFGSLRFMECSFNSSPHRPNKTPPGFSKAPTGGCAGTHTERCTRARLGPRSDTWAIHRASGREPTPSCAPEARQARSRAFAALARTPVRPSRCSSDT